MTDVASLQNQAKRFRDEAQDLQDKAAQKLNEAANLESQAAQQLQEESNRLRGGNVTPGGIFG